MERRPGAGVPREGAHRRLARHARHGAGDGLRQSQRRIGNRRGVHPQPGHGRAGLYGDVLFRAQGEDVVAGTHATEPIAALDARLPEARPRCAMLATRLERHYRDLCDIEFTVEDRRLWLLQVRVGNQRAAALRMAIEMAEDGRFPLASRGGRAGGAAARRSAARPAGGSGDAPARTGLGASPGVASARSCSRPKTRSRGRRRAGRDPGAAGTSPDDVHGMSRAAGILTARGGLAVTRPWWRVAGASRRSSARRGLTSATEVRLNGSGWRRPADDHDRR